MATAVTSGTMVHHFVLNQCTKLMSSCLRDRAVPMSRINQYCLIGVLRVDSVSVVFDWRSVFLENGEWGLIGMPAEVISAYYACCVHPYESVVFTIQVRLIVDGVSYSTAQELASVWKTFGPWSS